MGIIVTKENFDELNQKASKRFDKKTAESIVRNLCRALATDARFVKIAPGEFAEMAKACNFELLSGNFAETSITKDIIIKRENGINYRYYHSKNGVTRGWHPDAVAGLIKDGVKTSDAIAGFVFEAGQRIIKTNNPKPRIKPKSATK